MFQVIIKEIKTEEVKSREYEKIADSGNEEDDGAKYGYVDNVETQEREKEVYSQNVEKLDLQKVIKAINDIE